MLKPTTRRLTDQFVAGLMPQPHPVVIRDQQLNGLGIRVGRRNLMWVLQKERPARFGPPRKTHVVRLGRVFVMSLSEARTAAVRVLKAIDDGLDPTLLPENGNATTFREAWISFEKSLVNRVREGNASQRTLSHYQDLFRRVLVPLHGSTLAQLSAQPAVAKRLHEQITAKNGTATADSALRMARAVYRYSARDDRSLSAQHHLATSVEFSSKTSAVDDAMAVADLPGWWADLQAVNNPIRRELLLFSILTGLRRNDVLTARFEHLDLRRRVLHIPLPKGRKKFDLPLSRAAIRCLWRSRDAARKLYPQHASEWCFAGPSGRLAHAHQYRQKLRVGHSLRRTHASQALVAGVSSDVLALLLIRFDFEGTKTLVQ